MSTPWFWWHLTIPSCKLHVDGLQVRQWLPFPLPCWKELWYVCIGGVDITYRWNTCSRKFLKQDVEGCNMFKWYIYCLFFKAFHWTSSLVGWASFNFPLLCTWHLLLLSLYLQRPPNGSWCHVVDYKRCYNIAYSFLPN